MRNYKNILSVKIDETMQEEMDEVCVIEEQTRSGITRKAVKAYLRSPAVVQAMRENAPVDYLMR